MPARPFFDPPNDAERTVLALLARGYDPAAIAERLHLSRTGVWWRLAHLRDVWRLRSVPQLLILAGAMRWAIVPDREERTPLAPFAGVRAIEGRVTAGTRHPWWGPPG